LLEMIASGDHGGVKTICRDYPDEMPKANTVWCWLNPHHRLYDEVFRDGYLAAKEVTAHNLADAIIEDFNKLGNEGMDYRFANVRLSQVQWIAKSLAPKTYGERKQVELSGHMSYNDLSDAELERRIAEFTQGED